MIVQHLLCISALWEFSNVESLHNVAGKQRNTTQSWVKRSQQNQKQKVHAKTNSHESFWTEKQQQRAIEQPSNSNRGPAPCRHGMRACICQAVAGKLVTWLSTSGSEIPTCGRATFPTMICTSWLYQQLQKRSQYTFCHTCISKA